MLTFLWIDSSVGVDPVCKAILGGGTLLERTLYRLFCLLNLKLHTKGKCKNADICAVRIRITCVSISVLDLIDFDGLN